MVACLRGGSGFDKLARDSIRRFLPIVSIRGYRTAMLGLLQVFSSFYVSLVSFHDFSGLLLLRFDLFCNGSCYIFCYVSSCFATVHAIFCCYVSNCFVTVHAIFCCYVSSCFVTVHLLRFDLFCNGSCYILLLRFELFRNGSFVTFRLVL